MSGIVYESDSETVSEALDLFSLPAYQLAVESFFITELLPTHPLSNASNQIVFDAPISDEFSDLDQSLLVIKVKIKNSNNTNLAAFIGNDAANPAQANSVAFVNSAINSIFSGLDIKLNGISVNSNFFTNPYISYIQTILSYGADSFNSKLALAGWEIDKNFTDNAAHVGADVTSGFYKRAQKTSLSKEWTLMGNLHSPITQQARYLPPLLPISFVLTKSRPEFCLHSNAAAPNFIFDITSAKILLKRVRVLSTYKLRIESQLAKNDAIFPLRTFDCRPYSLDAGVKSFTFSNIFPGNSTIPDYCVIGLLEQTSYSGSYTSSPYNFKHFSLEEISISFDQYRYAYECEYDNGNILDYSSSYHALFQGAGGKSNSGLTITLEKFATGFALYSFHFGRDNVLSSDLWNNKIAGSARLSLKFSATSNNPALVVMVYSEENQLLKINSNREVIRTYNI